MTIAESNDTPSHSGDLQPRPVARTAMLVVLILLGASSACSTGDDHAGEEHQAHEAESAPRVDDHDEPAVDREIRLTPVQRELLAIEVKPAPLGHADAMVSAPAVVQFDPDRVARIGPRLEAKVVRVPVDLGDTVEAGDVMAVLDSVALGRARARFLTANAILDTAHADYERERRLAEQKISSEAEVLDARARFREAEAEQQSAREALRLFGLSAAAIDGTEHGVGLSRLTLTATMSGVVQRRDLSPGQTLGPADTPIDVVDDRKMWLMIDAFEGNLRRIAVGQPVEFESRALDGRRFSGRVDWISRELDQRSRTITLRAVLDNPDGVLRAGLFGTARIQTGAGEGPARVPIDAVQRLGEDDVVFVPAAEQDTFLAHPITLGHEGNGWVEVVSGLSAGDPVVFDGAFDLMAALTAAGRSAEHSH